MENQSLLVERRFAEGKADRLPAMAAELVQLKVDVIFVVSTPAVRAAQNATSTIHGRPDGPPSRRLRGALEARADSIAAHRVMWRMSSGR